MKYRKWFLACAALMGLLTVGLTVFLSAVRLKEPLFLPRCVTQDFYSQDSWEMQRSFSLEYFVNADDTRTVEQISFDGWTNEEVVFHAVKGLENTGAANLGMYALRTVYVVPQLNHRHLEEGGEIYKTMVLKIARVVFSDGSEQTVDIGEIQLHWDRIRGEKLGMHVSTGSSGGNSSETLSGEEDFTLLDLRFSPEVEAGELLSLTINGKNALNGGIRGMQLEKGERLHVEAKFPEPRDLDRRFTSYELTPVLTLRDSSGAESEEYLNEIYYDAVYAKDSIRQILRYVLHRKGGV